MASYWNGLWMSLLNEVQQVFGDIFLTTLRFCCYQQPHPAGLITHLLNAPSASLWTSSVALSVTARCSVIGRTSSHETAAWPIQRSCCWPLVVLTHLCSCSLEASRLINRPGEGKDGPGFDVTSESTTVVCVTVQVRTHWEMVGWVQRWTMLILKDLVPKLPWRKHGPT